MSEERDKRLEAMVKERPYALQLMTFQVLDDLAGAIEDLNERLGVQKKTKLNYDAPGSFQEPPKDTTPATELNTSLSISGNAGTDILENTLHLIAKRVHFSEYYSNHRFTSFGYGTTIVTTKDVVSDLRLPKSPDLLIVVPTTEAYIEFDDEIDTATTPSILSNWAFTVPLHPTFVSAQAVSVAGTLKIYAFWATDTNL